jgi:uncharacterized protein
VVEQTTQWLERVVIGLNLCPFAKPVHSKKLLRYAVSQSRSSKELLVDLAFELNHLHMTAPELVESTLLILPDVLADFEDYNSFLVIANIQIETMELGGVLQLASFHPHYLFEGTKEDDVSNYTNRSPFPILHLLRESSLTRAIESFDNVQGIYQRNIESLERIGLTHMQDMLFSICKSLPCKPL